MSSQGTKVVVFLGVLGAASYFLYTRKSSDPGRDAKARVEKVIQEARSSDANAKKLDDALLGPDLALVPHETAQRAGVEVIRIAASRAGSDKVDQANRLVRRYQLLPATAQGDAALGELLTTLDGWAMAIDAKEGDAKIAILRQAKLMTDATHSPDIGKKLATAKLEVARQKTADAPLEALALFVEEPVAPSSIDEAGKLLASLVESPSLLDEAGRDLDVWLKATKDTALSTRVSEQVALARSVRAEDESEKTPAELAAMQKQRPWDQRVAIRLALNDLDAGKAPAAEARLQAFGKPSLLVRDARLLLARIAMQQGKLDVADELVSSMLSGRLQQFVAASAALDLAATEFQTAMETKLKTGNLPADTLRKLETASEAQQGEIINEWYQTTAKNDVNVAEKREAMIALSDVVSASIFAGTIKVQRAQGMSGTQRDAMLAAAERTFLAVRSAAEGQPEYHLGLGEIYARLGKVAESDKEFQSILDRNDATMTLAVASIYRNIGNQKRSTEITTKLYETTTDDKMKKSAAFMLYHLARTEDEQEKWLKVADQKAESVKTALLEVEANKLRKKGDWAACDKKFAEVAKAHLAIAQRDEAGFNNAAIAHMSRFACTGDVTSLRDAEQVLERAYRAASDSPIVVANFASVLESNAFTRAIAKRIDIKSIKLTQGEAYEILATLLDSSERDAVLADLNADPAWKKSAQIFAQAEVLQPNSTNAYAREFSRARLLRDVTEATAVLDRLKRAPKLDTSEAVKNRQDFVAGTSDARIKEELDAQIARLEPLASAKGVTAKTQAAVGLLLSNALLRRATIFGTTDDLTRSLALLRESEKAWPALRTDNEASLLIDQMGLELAKDRWLKIRRERGSVASLNKLVDDKDPLAAKFKGHATWAQLAPLLRAQLVRPGVGSLRLARMTGDAEAIAKAAPAFEDKLIRLDLEFDKITDPSQPVNDEDLTFLDKK